MLNRTTSDGVRIDSYALHFIDRVIGQTAEPHEGMREATTIEAVIEALTKPKKITERMMADGDVRRTYRGGKANIPISVRDHRLIQEDPRGGKNDH